MEKRYVRHYECDGGENPKNHHPVNMRIISNGVSMFQVWSNGGSVHPRDSYDTLDEAKEAICKRYDTVIQTGYAEEYYFKKNIKIK